MGQVRGYSAPLCMYQQAVAAQGQVAERRQQERARAEAQRARVQPSMRTFFKPGGEVRLYVRFAARAGIY